MLDHGSNQPKEVAVCDAVPLETVCGWRFRVHTADLQNLWLCRTQSRSASLWYAVHQKVRIVRWSGVIRGFWSLPEQTNTKHCSNER